MALSYTSISGGGGATTGFAIDTGDGTKTDVTLTKEYPAGGYQVSSANGNQGLFIFFGASDGTPAGGTSSKSIVATKAFNKLTIIGVTANDLITFTYKETATLNAVGTSSTYSGAVVTSFTPNQISAVNDTLILNGAALGANVTVKFTGANNIPLNAKSITRVSDTQLIVTRPDTMPGDQDPYKITVQNPGIEPAVSTSTATQPLYAGSAPTWSTASTLPAFTKNTSYTQQLVASDPDLTALTFSFVSGSLPAGLTYAANTSTISGTPTGSTAATFTIRATELSGRYTDRTFVLPNAYPVFTTGATLSSYSKNVSYSTTIVATDDSGVAPSLSVVGTMPNGLSFNALTGAVSGTPTTSTTQTFTIRATDANGSTTDNTFTIPNNGPSWVTEAGALPIFSKNVAYSTTVSATDDGTIVYSIVSGSLPAGVSLNSSTGVISGTPTSGLSRSFTIRAQDDAGNYVDRAFSTANTVPTWVTTSSTFTRPTNVAFSLTLSATEDSTIVYSVASGTLPTGLSLNSTTGVISGTPTVTATNVVVFNATDDNGSVAANSPTITFVVRAATTFTLGTLPAAFVPGDIINIAYTGSAQTFTKLNATSVKLVCRGAAGAGFSGTPQTRPGGSGGYSEGNYAISGNIYAFVGGGGGSGQATNQGVGGFNGGGTAPGTGSYNDNWQGGGGGGTDFRTAIGGGSWNDATGLSARIIVAGGGGGANGYSNDSNQVASGGNGGGTNGSSGGSSGQNSGSFNGGTQSAGGSPSTGGNVGSAGGLGFGGNGAVNGSNDPSGPGGGGGYYGGGAGSGGSEFGGGGGSGYIGGVTSGSMTNGNGTAGAATPWSVNNQGNGSAQITILAVA